MSSDKVYQIAKKHKRVFEKYGINPGIYRVNNHDYYFVYFERKKLTGYAIISPHCSSNSDEYKEAYDWLLKCSQLTNSVYINAGFKAKVDFTSFLSVRDYLEKALEREHLVNGDRELLQTCLHSLHLIIELQQQLIDGYKEFLSNAKQIQLKQNSLITKEYVNGILNFLGEFDYIQYTQMSTQYNTIDEFSKLYEIIKHYSDLNKALDEETKAYLKKFIQSKSNLYKNIKKLAFQPNMEQLSKEEHIKVAKKITLENIEKIKIESLKKLRYPKF